MRRREVYGNETAIVKAIMDAIRSASGWVIRSNVTRRISSRGVNAGEAGMADLLVFLPDGHVGAMEVKRPGEKQSEKQLEWEQRAKCWGVRYAVVHSATEALEVHARWMRECKS